MTTPSWVPQMPQLPKLNARLGATDECALYDWLHQHRLAAVEAYRKSLKPVAWAVYWEDGWLSNVTIPDPRSNLYDDGQSKQSAVQLFRLEDQP